MHARGARIDELPALWDGFARLVRPGLGLSAFGANVMNLPPDYATKSHDESSSGQEELYVCLAGSGAVVLDEDGTELAAGRRAARRGRARRRAHPSQRAGRPARAGHRRLAREGLRAAGLVEQRRVAESQELAFIPAGRKPGPMRSRFGPGSLLVQVAVMAGTTPIPCRSRSRPP